MHWRRKNGHSRDCCNRTSYSYFVPSTAQICCCCSHRSDTITILYNIQMTYIHAGGKAEQWRQYGRRWWNKVFPRNARDNWILFVTMLNFTSSCQLPSCQLRLHHSTIRFVPPARLEGLCKGVEETFQVFFKHYWKETRGQYHALAV